MAAAGHAGPALDAAGTVRALAAQVRIGYRFAWLAEIDRHSRWDDLVGPADAIDLHQQLRRHCMGRGDP